MVAALPEVGPSSDASLLEGIADRSSDGVLHLCSATP